MFRLLLMTVATLLQPKPSQLSRKFIDEWHDWVMYTNLGGELGYSEWVAQGKPERPGPDYDVKPLIPITFTLD